MCASKKGDSMRKNILKTPVRYISGISTARIFYISVIRKRILEPIVQMQGRPCLHGDPGRYAKIQRNDSKYSPCSHGQPRINGRIMEKFPAGE